MSKEGEGRVGLMSSDGEFSSEEEKESGVKLNLEESTEGEEEETEGEETEEESEEEGESDEEGESEEDGESEKEREKEGEPMDPKRESCPDGEVEGEREGEDNSRRQGKLELLSFVKPQEKQPWTERCNKKLKPDSKEAQLKRSRSVRVLKLVETKIKKSKILRHSKKQKGDQDKSSQVMSLPVWQDEEEEDDEREEEEELEEEEEEEELEEEEEELEWEESELISDQPRRIRHLDIRGFTTLAGNLALEKVNSVYELYQLSKLHSNTVEKEVVVRRAKRDGQLTIKWPLRPEHCQWHLPRVTDDIPISDPLFHPTSHYRTLQTHAQPSHDFRRGPRVRRDLPTSRHPRQEMLEAIGAYAFKLRRHHPERLTKTSQSSNRHWESGILTKLQTVLDSCLRQVTQHGLEKSQLDWSSLLAQAHPNQFPTEVLQNTHRRLAALYSLDPHPT